MWIFPNLYSKWWILFAKRLEEEIRVAKPMSSVRLDGVKAIRAARSDD
jgi:hypothetical protein